MSENCRKVVGKLSDSCQKVARKLPESCQIVARKLINRTSFPRFDGRQETWAEFRRLFTELLKESRQSKVLEIARLTEKIQEEARRMITGITNPQEAWERLDERYKDKKLAS